MARQLAVCALVLAAAAGGCSFGPKAIEKTHGRYAESVRKVEEEQLLRKIVLLRYNESPVGLDLSTIAAQSEIGASAEARPFFIAPNPSNSNIVFRTFTSILPDAAVNGSNRPTVTMTPDTDGASVRRFLAPITLDTLTFIVQSGWPVDNVMRVWVERMNGVPNGVGASGPADRDGPTDDGRFRRAADLLQSAKRRELATIRVEERAVPVGGPLPAGAVTAAAVVDAARGGLEFKPAGDGKEWALTRTERKLVVEVSPGAEHSPEMVEISQLLNLSPGRSRYEVGVANRGSPDPALFPAPPADEVRVVPRSTAQAAYFLANGVEVPAAHACAGLVTNPDTAPLTQGLFAVHSCGGHKPPATAFVAVRYRGYWYYIDDRDHASKTTFALMFHLSRLDFTRDPPRGPALTLPIGR
ncbi:MAG TPA: hypothetical protein VH092_33900 [Urbifossiella sp.]|nr:hypothetical protein [Urbifossiella sp.]